MDPELKEIPPNEDAKKKKKKNKNKKKKNKNKENFQEANDPQIKPEVPAQAQPNNQKTKPTTAAPQINRNFVEDEIISNATKPNIKPPTIPNFNLEPTEKNPEKPERAEVAEEDDSEDEGIEDYKLGGYHPVHIGEVILERYVVLQKLGWGHFSTVWLCKDFKYDSYVAIKIQKSSPHYLEAAYDEVEILQRVAKNTANPEWLRSLKEYYKDEGRTKFTKDDCHVVQLLNSFIYQGPYGNHFCMVFEIMGVNLLEIIKRYEYKGVPMPLCRRMAKQILIGLDYLHRICGVIHTDLKPENILICLTKEQTKDIVENGQLSRSQKYEERIREYQKIHKIKIDEPKKDVKPKLLKKKEEKTTVVANKEAQKPQEAQQQEDQEEGGEEKKGKGKNRRKKEYKKRKKQKDRKVKEENEKLMSYGFDPEVLDPDMREKILAEIREEEGVEDEDEEGEKEEEKEEEPQVQPTTKKEDKDEGLRGPKLEEDFRIKIVDLGNACWTHHHFTPKIQTRQYRSPEVILGLHYDSSADIWSFACTIFEMLTGDFLFEPRKGQNFGKNDDHFAQVIELLSLLPKNYVHAGKNAKKFFDKSGNLRRIQGFHYWPLKNVLTDKYQMKEHEAEALASFLLPMLDYYPLKRSTAQQSLRHYWLKMPYVIDYKMNEEETAELMNKRQYEQDNGVELEHERYAETDENDADDSLEESDLENDSEENAWYSGEHNYYGYKHVLNKSYGNGVYTGYADGIIVNELDVEGNWQFKDKK